MQDERGQDPFADTAKDIEAFAKLVIEFTRKSVDAGEIAPAFVPEALLLAAVDLAARHNSDAQGVADWLERVSQRLREHDPSNGDPLQ